LQAKKKKVNQEMCNELIKYSVKDISESNKTQSVALMTDVSDLANHH